MHRFTSIKKVPAIVIIQWVDAQTNGGAEWLSHEEMLAAAKEKLPLMHSVGYLVFEDDDQYCVTSTLGPNESSQVHKIPKRMVVSVKKHGRG